MSSILLANVTLLTMPMTGPHTVEETMMDALLGSLETDNSTPINWLPR